MGEQVLQDFFKILKSISNSPKSPKLALITKILKKILNAVVMQELIHVVLREALQFVMQAFRSVSYGVPEQFRQFVREKGVVAAGFGGKTGFFGEGA